MSDTTATIQISAKTEKLDKRQETYWDIVDAAGKKYRAWQKDNKEGFELAAWYECALKLQEKYAPQITSSRRVDMPAPEAQASTAATPTGPSSQAGVPPEVWEARDRRIDMESAYSSAARFFQGREAAIENLVDLARHIYSDIQAAGAGRHVGPVVQEAVSDAEPPAAGPADTEALQRLWTLARRLYSDKAQATIYAWTDKHFNTKDLRSLTPTQLAQVTRQLQELLDKKGGE